MVNTYIIKFHPQYFNNPKTVTSTVESEPTKPTHCSVGSSNFIISPGIRKVWSVCVGQKKVGLFLAIKRTEKNAGNWIGHQTDVPEVAGLILVSVPIAFVEIWSWNNFYGHSLPVVDPSISRRWGVWWGSGYKWMVYFRFGTCPGTM